MVFVMVSESICFLLNGKDMQVQSKEEFAERRKEHEHEQWIFLNGVAVGFVPPLLQLNHLLIFITTESPLTVAPQFQDN